MYGRLRKSLCGHLICDWKHLSSAAPATKRSNLPRALRCQSTAVHQQPEDTNPTEDVENGGAPRPSRDSTPSRLRYRHWQPHASAELGIESLGEPAEVLILPTRERKLQRIHTPPKNTEERSSRYLADSDASTLSWDGIKQNILAVRDSVVESDSINIDLGRWTKLRDLVSSGFTKQQLRKLLTEGLGTGQVSEPVKDSASKKHVAEYIMKQLWGLKIEIDQSTEAGEQAVKTEAERDAKVKKTLSVNNVALDLALQQEGRQLRKICDALGVQIDVFREKSKLAVTGDLPSVMKAREKLTRLLKQPQHANITLSDDVQALSQNPQFGKYLKHLTQKHNLRIVRKSNVLSVHAFNAISIDFLRQDLACITLHDRRNANHSLWGGGQRLFDLAKAKAYPTGLRHWFLEQQAWYRYVSKESIGMPELSMVNEIATNAQQKLDRMKLPSIENIHSSLVSRRKDIQSEYSAKLGCALFNPEKSVPSALQSAFFSNVAMIPQTLKNMSKDAALLARQQLMLVQLKPCGREMKLPCLDIYMSREDISKGLEQHLTITKVVINFGNAIHDVLLPAKQVDIRIQKQRTLELFNLSGDAPLPEHLPLLKSLSKIVQGISSRGPNEEQKRNSEFPIPVHEVDLTPLLTEVPEMRSANSVPADEPKTKQLSLPLPDDAIKILTAIRKQTSPPTGSLYAVETPKWLDIAHYTHPLHPGLIIEHTLSSTVTNPSQHRDYRGRRGRRNENNAADQYSQSIEIKFVQPLSPSSSYSSPSWISTSRIADSTSPNQSLANEHTASMVGGRIRQMTSKLADGEVGIEQHADKDINSSDVVEKLLAAAMYVIDLLTTTARRGL